MSTECKKKHRRRHWEGTCKQVQGTRARTARASTHRHGYLPRQTGGRVAIAVPCHDCCGCAKILIIGSCLVLQRVREVVHVQGAAFASCYGVVYDAHPACPQFVSTVFFCRPCMSHPMESQISQSDRSGFLHRLLLSLCTLLHVYSFHTNCILLSLSLPTFLYSNNVSPSKNIQGAALEPTSCQWIGPLYLSRGKCSHIGIISVGKQAQHGHRARRVWWRTWAVCTPFTWIPSSYFYHVTKIMIMSRRDAN